VDTNNEEDLIRRIQANLSDDFDEELELELDDRRLEEAVSAVKRASSISASSSTCRASSSSCRTG